MRSVTGYNGAMTMALQFTKDAKVAILNIGSWDTRISEAFVERVTKTKLVIRFPNGAVSNETFNIKTDLEGNQEGRHAHSAYHYHKHWIEVWQPKHDQRIAERQAEQEANRKIRLIQDKVRNLHISERDLIDRVFATLELKLEG